jgi:recombination protein RecR
MERAGAFRGQYHVLGGTLSALDGIRPEDLNISDLISRAVRRPSERSYFSNERDY